MRGEKPAGGPIVAYVSYVRSVLSVSSPKTAKPAAFAAGITLDEVAQSFARPFTKIRFV